MRTSFRVKTLAVVITASLGGVIAPSVWSVSTVSDNPVAAVSAPASALKTYMVEFAEEGALHYDGGIGTLRGSSQKITGDQNFNSQRVEVQAYVSFLENAIATRTAAISNQLGRSVEVTHRYFYTHAGVAMQLDDYEAQQVRSMVGVKDIVLSTEQTLDTFRGPTFIGAPTVWNLAAPGGSTNRGAGVRIAILDSGANSAHPSFANDASCGFSAVTNPKLVAVSCATATGPGGACNGPNPEADAVSSSHGVHTAGTAGGNTLTAATVPAPTLPAPATEMSGVAPCAGINSYKVCNTPAGQCAGADTVAATNNAIAAVATGIKALNFSISGGTNPWTNGESDRVFLDAINAGIFVAASAGNTSTTVTNPIGAVNHKGPWTMTVANSYHDLNTAAKLSVTGPTAPANLQNIVMNKGSTTPTGTLLSTTPIKASPTNLAGCTDTGAFPAGYFAGSIAVVRRGFNAPGTVACGFAEKINNAANAGALAVIITNNQAGAISMDTTAVTVTGVPAYSISSQAIGDSLLVPFLNANATATATFDPTGVLPDKLADSSLRGPTAVHVDVTKPDISGPGTGIYAAARTEEGSYIYLSGTSMSGPHVAGAGALLRAVRPTWTPTEVKSALQMTSKKNGFKDDGTGPWDIDDAGSGRVDLTKAAGAGLVMDETYARFLASNPSGGTINVKELNIPSLRNMACGSSCTFTRTVKSTLSTTANWTASSLSASNLQITVSPATFSIVPGGTQVLTFTVSPPAYGLPIVAPAVGFGYAILTEAASQSPALHITAAIRGTGDGIFKNGFDSSVVPAGVLVDEYTNRVITSQTAGAGGLPVSELQTALGLSTFGAGAQITASNVVAEDFTVPAGGWSITKAKFYTYQTGGGPVSTINNLQVRVFSGTPSGTLVYGDTTTNRMTSTVAKGVYRAQTSAITDSTRPIYEVVAEFSPAITLPAGTHWIAWSMGGTGASGPWAVPQTVVGTASTGNCQQATGTGGGVFAPLVDTGTSLAALGCAFLLEGTAP